MPAPLLAQEAPSDPMATAAPSPVDQVTAARQAAPEAKPCKPKKKKGFGLGGILKAASKSGLASMVGGGVIGGYGGAVASTAINTGVGVAESSAAAKPASEGC
ncbi:hypothetical protein P6144_11205 [Sphingomonas sp. HITSZ_GF]|uniref:hypothetical protein n=1 Tax=Sphingomonas sp. HITSZ_GF TaxID=3037247 RepID=UPI00240D288F|nr:hypothetical protein [Sphingomonas sp. HITSZ_GF]MDG2534219.1 hypothetical protein [Sphingomonas sp. HITSZ_GF]